MHNYVHVYVSKYNKKTKKVDHLYDRSECRTQGCRDVARFPTMQSAPVEDIIAMSNSRQEWFKPKGKAS